jgi:plastocyanin
MAIVKRYIRLSLVAALVIFGALIGPRIVASLGARDDVREIRLVARDMTYYVDTGSDGDTADDPNPTLRFKAGEQIRIAFRNDDRGMSHDFTIRAWGVSTKVLNGKGDDSITFRVPEDTKSVRYVCTPHAGMMSGQIVVE